MTRSITKFLVIICIFTMICGCGSGSKLTEAEEEKARLFERLLFEDNYIIVDVRTEEEYATSHVVGAVNIPYDTIDENVELDMEKSIIVYCQSGRRSAIAYNALEVLGYEVFDLGAYGDITLDKE